MNDVLPEFIYEPNFVVSYLIPLILVISVFNARLLAVFFTSIILLRPNERFYIPVSYPTLVFCLSMLAIVVHYEIIKGFTFKKQDRIIVFLVIYILSHCAILYPSQFNKAFFVCAVGTLRYLLIIMFLSDMKGAKWLYFCLYLSCSVIIFEALYYHYFVSEDSVEWMLFHGSTGRIRGWGIWGNANETSFISCLGTVGIVFLVIASKFHYFYCLLAITSVPLFLLTVFLTASRTGLCCFFLLFVGLIYKSKSKPFKIVVAICMTGIIVIAPMLTPERTDKEASSEERAELREKGIEMFKERPIRGVGFYRSSQETGGMALHNTYVQVFAETGFLGGFLFVFFLYLIGIHLYRTQKKSLRDTDGCDDDLVKIRIVNGLLGVYISFVLYLLFGNQFFSVMFFTACAFIRISADAFSPELTSPQTNNREKYV